jgi:hypothetical protein
MSCAKTCARVSMAENFHDNKALKQLLTDFPARRPKRCATEGSLRLDIGCLIVKGIDQCEERHVSGSPAVHGSMANTALGIAPLPERQASRRHFVFGPAIGTFEDHHSFTPSDGDSFRKRILVFTRPQSRHSNLWTKRSQRVRCCSTTARFIGLRHLGQVSFLNRSKDMVES